MTTAVVLIEAERDALQTLGGRLADLDGVAEAYSVTGEWDFVAIMPIGGHYTMDRFDAVVAAEWIGADTIIPCHYGTFPPIETDVEAFKADVQGAGAGEVAILNPGDTHTV